jgi:hypothetical protein
MKAGLLRLLIGVFLSLVGLGALVLMWSRERVDLFLMVPAGFLLVGLVFVGAAVAELLARGVFEEVEVEVPEEGVALGASARVRVRLVPKRPLKVSGASLALVTQERAEYRAGTDTRTYEAELHRWETPLKLPLEFHAPVELELSIPVPRELPPTFSGRSNWLKSEVHLHVALQGWPDLRVREEVVVLPRYA